MDRNVTCTGDRSFISTFCKPSAGWPGPRAGREGSATGKELTCPLPCLLRLHGASREAAQASVFAGHGDLFNPAQKASVTILSPNI